VLLRKKEIFVARDSSVGIRENFINALRKLGICGFADGIVVEEVPGGFLYVKGRETKHLFKADGRLSEIVSMLEIRGILRRCPLGCVNYCILS
jgi:hypothetical protein